MRGILRGTIVILLAITLANAGASDNTASDVSVQLERATNGDADAALWLSKYFGRKNSSSYDPSKSEEWRKTAAKLGNIVAISEIGYDKPYMAVSLHQCGKNSIVISTSCTSVDKEVGRPLCYSQHFSMEVERHYIDYFFLNENFRTDMTIAYEIECVQAQNASWLVVRSTNFGSGRSCLDCEREDYFGNGGQYLGSSRSERGRKIVRGYKEVSFVTLQAIDNARKFDPSRGQVFKIQTYPILNGSTVKEHK